MQTNPDYEMHLRPEEDYEMHFDDAGLKPEQTATVTPTYEEQTVRPDPGCVFSEVTVEAIPEPTEEIDITENGPVNVARYGTANVNVPQGVFPSGTKLITQNVTGVDVTNYAAVDVAVPGPTGTKQISITQNGTTTEDVMNYADAEITVNTLPAKGLVLEDYDADGYPTKCEFIGTWTVIPRRFFYYCQYSGTSFLSKISHISIPDSVTTIESDAFLSMSYLTSIEFPNNDITIQGNAFHSNTNVTHFLFKKDVAFVSEQNVDGARSALSIVFGGNVNAITNLCFRSANNVQLYDFSHCTAIPPLYSVASLGHATGCVIRIPAALSDTTLGEGNGWESATNWSALTNIVWEVV